MKKLLTALLLLFLTGCQSDAVEENNENPYEGLDVGYLEYLDIANPEVSIQINDYEPIVVQLFPELAPNTVNNFLTLSKEGFYDESIFYYVVQDFVAIGGDPTNTGVGGAGYAIEGELPINGYQNTLSHTKGVISMVNTGDVNTASSQFFLMESDISDLDGSYTAFGGIISGFETLDLINNAEVNQSQKPFEDLVIKSITLNTKAYHIQEVVTYDASYHTASTYQSDTNPEVVIEFETFGSVTLELFPEIAPITVENFLTLIGNDFYSNLIMHRIISGFMVQGGDPTGTGAGGSDQDIVGEFRTNGVNNPLTHERGVISMARSQSPDSASSQFFIVHQDAFFLDGAYAAFGVVTDGLDVIDQIAAVEVDQSDKPLTNVVIKSITQTK